MTNAFARLARRLASLAGAARRERDMRDEMGFHVEMEARELERAGHPRRDAERLARLRFGGVERHKEAGRDARGTRLAADLEQDLRYALRQCVHAPAFTLAMVVTLGLSVGASTFMYSFVTMSPVPFPDADRLVYLRQWGEKACPSCDQVSAGNALAFAQSSRALEGLAFVYGPSATPLRRGDRSDVVSAVAVTYQFFSILRLHALLGRTLLPADTLAGATPVAMLSEALWRTRYGGDSSIVGRDIVLDGKHRTVRGIVADDDVYPEGAEIWVPFTLAASEKNDHASDLNYLTIGRLRAGATLEQARAEAATVSSRLLRDYPSDFRFWKLDVRPLARYGRGAAEDAKIFSVAAGFVLVIACINLAGLLIARLTRRRRELAVRVAMGAHAGRLTRQLLTEVLLVCLVAGGVGAFAASGGLHVLIRTVPARFAPPGFSRLGVDRGAFVFALALATGCGLLIALLPSLRFARPSLNDELRDGRRSGTARGLSGGERVRRVLVVLELALSVVLLAAAGLLLRTQANIARAPVGLAGDHVVTASVQLPSEVDGHRALSLGYFDRLAADLASVPGVTSAGAVAYLPLGGSGGATSMFQIEGHAPIQGSGGTRRQVVTPGYFATFKIPIIRGRAFTSFDDDSTNRVALVNQALVTRFFPGEDPLGRVLLMANGWRLTVIGVVADVKQYGATADPGQEVLVPASTVPRQSMTMVVRTAADPAESAPAIVKAIAAFDPNLAVNRVRTMSAVIDESLAAARVGEVAMIVLATIAVVIATMGLFAIMSYTVAARTREFGVRLAIGASRRTLLGLVLGQGLRLALFGIVLGLACSLAVMRGLAARLYGVTPTDPLTLAAVVVGMAVVAVVAGLVPAQRALSVDPVTSLRAE